MTRLVQLNHPQHGRKVAVVYDSELCLLSGFDSIYRLAQHTITNGKKLEQTVADCATSESISYDLVHNGQSDWRLLPAFDHPDEPGRCLVTGTGLTHKKSADNRQAMHSD